MNKTLCLSGLILLQMSLLTAQVRDTSSLPQAGDKDTLKIYINPEKDLFNSSDPMRVTCILSLKEFLRNNDESKSFDAQLTIYLGPGDSIAQKVKMKSTGNFRRTYCSFPPISLTVGKINEKKKNTENQHTIKLINQCQNSKLYEGYLMKEYLVYRMYNLFSPYSFKVRLLIITYRDSRNPKNHYEKYGFLIENPHKMASRNKAKLVKEQGLTRLNVLPEDITRTALFEYMVGNTDWTASAQHNIKVLDPVETNVNRRIFVPHDFDYSGFVNAVYAAPADNINQESVKQRVYLGGCVSDQVFDSIFSEFLSKKEAITRLVMDFSLLDKSERSRSMKYLDEFFLMLNNRKEFITILRRSCVPIVR